MKNCGTIMLYWKSSFFVLFLFIFIAGVYKCVIGIGSNYDRARNMSLAREQLLELFPGILFAPERETKPIYLKNPALFSNQVAAFSTEKEKESVLTTLKTIECLSGRSPEDKSKERICLDIDLLAYDDQIVKPEDWQREYIQKDLSIINNL